MALDYQALMARIVVNEKAALAALSPTVVADAVPRFWHTQESFPYFTNRLGSLSVDFDSEDIDLVTQDVTMRLVIGHLTSGYVGENDDKLQLWLPQLHEYFNEREGLQSATYLTRLTNLTRARIVSGTGYIVFVNSPIGGVAQVGAELTIRCELDHDIQHVYS